ncbi:MAG: hypothetical protein KIT00_04790 [Rhodospirillales bacterium]|nr:hypothetical protein [Rhodospirillales bacterium]
MRRRPIVPQRKLYFAACEGDGERAYVALLNRLAGDRRLHIWIHGEPLNPGAGDALAMVERACERLAFRRRKGATYGHAVLFLDSDTAENTPERTQRAWSTAQEHGIQLIWQRPNLEAVLLRHLGGCERLQPPATQSFVELQRRWPEYDKRGISADKLARRIGYPQVVQASQVEPDLQAFLLKIGLI